jgi:hypothetical protein
MVKKGPLISVPTLDDNFRTVVTISSKYVPSEPVAEPLMVIKSKYIISSEIINFVLKH